MSGTTTDQLDFTTNGVTFDLTLTVEGTTGLGQVEAITGTVGSAPITGIDTSFEGPDNTISASYPYLDYNGLGFDTATSSFNLYNLNGSPVLISSDNSFFNTPVTITDFQLCFLRGSLILTPYGEVPVESLGIGYRVVTRAGAFQKIKWIGRQTCDIRQLASGETPVRIHANALGEGRPIRDLIVSPGHSILLGNTLVLARALVNGATITQTTPADFPGQTIDYFQIELEGHDCVLAEGTWAETFADGPGLRRQFHNAADFHALYPDYREPAEILLCAPRPQSGPELDAALRPIVERAAAGTTPGQLQGYVDRVTRTELSGWALDADHPALPVLLHILLDGEVIHSVLACDHREDLQSVGTGTGRCSFALTWPSPLPQTVLSQLSVRRASDNATLPMTADCLAHITQPASPPLIRVAA